MAETTGGRGTALEGKAAAVDDRASKLRHLIEQHAMAFHAAQEYPHRHDEYRASASGFMADALALVGTDNGPESIPRKPTQAMQEAGLACFDGDSWRTKDAYNWVRKLWGVMYDAAPPPDGGTHE
jgi:hypothetical protein